VAKGLTPREHVLWSLGVVPLEVDPDPYVPVGVELAVTGECDHSVQEIEEFRRSVSENGCR